MSHYLISEASRLVDEESHVLRYWEDELALKIPRNDLGHRYYTEVQLEVFRTIKELKQQGYQLKEIKQYLEEMEKDKSSMIHKELERDEPSMLHTRTPESGGAGERGGNGDTGSALPGSDASEEVRPGADFAGAKLSRAGQPESELSEMGLPGAKITALQEAADIPLTLPTDARQQARMKEFRELMTDILADVMVAGMDRMTDEVSDRVSCRMIKEMNYLDRERENREEARFKELDEAIRRRQKRGKYRAEAAATAAQKNRRRWIGKARPGR